MAGRGAAESMNEDHLIVSHEKKGGLGASASAWWWTEDGGQRRRTVAGTVSGRGDDLVSSLLNN